MAFGSTFNLSDLDGSNGFIINGISGLDYSGAIVSDAGDVNNDGFDDVIIGAYGVDGNTGASYVVFGSDQPFSADFELAALDGNNGFVLTGINRSDHSGRAVSSVGDINDDGIDDFIIGAFLASPDGKREAGQVYVVFGDPNLGTNGSFALSNLDGANGFVIDGIAPGDYLGRRGVAGAGDINGDGIDDLVIGAHGAAPNGVREAGQSYVIFGNSSLGDSGSLDLKTLDGNNGFFLNGIRFGDESGFAASDLGDINGDGLDDLIIGSENAGTLRAGEAYVVFGSDQGFRKSLELADLDGTNGFIVGGLERGDRFGFSVSGAGDFNNDGYNDVLIGAFLGGEGSQETGTSHIIFGSPSIGSSGSVDLLSLNGINGFVINGINNRDFAGGTARNAGDVNGDGIEDIIIGADRSNGGTGKSYVVYGSNITGRDGVFELADLDGSNGFTVFGIDKDDYAGWAVNNAGDFNGDGVDDFLVSAPFADPNDRSRAGESYLVFGQEAVTTVVPDGSVTLAEDTTYTFSAADFSFLSIDLNSLVRLRITHLPGSGSLTFAGSSVTEGQLINATSLTDLAYKSEADEFGKDYARFSFEVLNANEFVNPKNSYSFSIDVTSVMDAPELKRGIFDVGNILASSRNYLWEFTPGGGVKQSFRIPGFEISTGTSRGLALDRNNQVHIYNGTFDPFLSTYNPDSQRFTHQTLPGWSTANNGSFGGVATFQNFVFVSDMSTSGNQGADQAEGILRVDLNNNGFKRFADNEEFIDVTIGLNDWLYGLTDHGEIWVYDPLTLELKATVNLPFLADIRGIAVDANGNVFAVDWRSDSLIQYDGSGSELMRRKLPNFARDPVDIDLMANGQILVGARSGSVTITDKSLKDFSYVVHTPESTFVAGISLTVPLNDATENAPAPAGAVGTAITTLVESDFAVDRDPDTILGVAITAIDTVNGSWWYSLDNGANWLTFSSLGSITDSNALLLDENARLYFQPTPDFDGRVINALNYRAWDQSSGSSGLTADVSTNGGRTAFSRSVAGAAITVIPADDFTPVNDAPIMSNLDGDQVEYIIRSGGVNLDAGGDALVTDEEGSFAGGQLSVKIVANGVTSEDLLTLHTSADVSLGGSFNGSPVTVDGITIATLTHTITPGKELVLQLNELATAATVTKLVQALRYENTNRVNPDQRDRTLRISLTDGNGGSTTPSEVTVTINPDPGSDSAQSAVYQLVADINPGQDGSLPHALAVFNNKLYFSANDGSNPNGGNTELWEYDGTATRPVADIYVGSQGSNPYGYTTFKDKLYFSAKDEEYGTELWVYDGNTTQLVADLRPGTDNSHAESLTVFNDKLYFSARISDQDSRLWVYDGTTVQLVADVDSDNTPAAPSQLTVFNGKLYFSAEDEKYGTELWVYDGNTTQLVADINPGSASSRPSELTSFDNKLYFKAENVNSGSELWVYDGSTTQLVADINPGTYDSSFDDEDRPNNSSPQYLTVFNGKLYFNARDSNYGTELWVYDGNTAQIAADIRPGSSSSLPSFLTTFNDKLYFNANVGDKGNELWVYDGNSAQLVADINPASSYYDYSDGFYRYRPNGSNPHWLTVFDDKLFFRADDGTSGKELWVYDPVAPEVVQVAANLAKVRQEDIGQESFLLTVNFSEAMDTRVAPTLTFPNEDPSGTLQFATGYWVDADTYVATYDVLNTTDVLPAIDVSISGAKDTAGNLQQPLVLANQFDIDLTPSPVLEEPNQPKDILPVLEKAETLDAKPASPIDRSMPSILAGQSLVGLTVHGLDMDTSLRIGGIRLSTFFDEHFYLSQYQDVAEAITQGVMTSGYYHFVNFGLKEGRNPIAYYNEASYLSNNADVKASVAKGEFSSGVEHFLLLGHRENRNPSGLFDANDYLLKSPDVEAAVKSGDFLSGFEHFLEFGSIEGRLSFSLYQESDYLAIYSDVGAAVQSGDFESGWQHFRIFGIDEGRLPSSQFNESAYLATNPDVAAAVIAGHIGSGVEHFFRFGYGEARALG